MGVVETTGEELLAGLDASAEVDPATEKRRARRRAVVVIVGLALLQAGWAAALAYAAFFFVTS